MTSDQAPSSSLERTSRRDEFAKDQGSHRSTAVMQRRAKTAPDSLDYFPTPPWATRAFCKWLIERYGSLDVLSAWEPACGEEHMSNPLREFFEYVRASDIYQYGNNEIFNFSDVTEEDDNSVDWLITNPPFSIAQQFIDDGLRVARKGVAMLVRGAFLEGQDRYNELYSKNPPSHIIQYTERVCLLEKRLIQANKPDPFNLDEDGNPRKASNATSYVWVVWVKDNPNPEPTFHWIPPSRTLLEKPDDYPSYEEYLEAYEGDLMQRNSDKIEGQVKNNQLSLI